MAAQQKQNGAEEEKRKNKGLDELTVSGSIPQQEQFDEEAFRKAAAIKGTEAIIAASTEAAQLQALEQLNTAQNLQKSADLEQASLQAAGQAALERGQETAAQAQQQNQVAQQQQELQRQQEEQAQQELLDRKRQQQERLKLIKRQQKKSLVAEAAKKAGKAAAGGSKSPFFDSVTAGLLWNPTSLGIYRGIKWLFKNR